MFQSSEVIMKTNILCSGFATITKNQEYSNCILLHIMHSILIYVCVHMTYCAILAKINRIIDSYLNLKHTLLLLIVWYNIIIIYDMKL